MINIGIEEAKIIIRIIDRANEGFQAGENANLINSRLKEHIREAETSEKQALNIADISYMFSAKQLQKAYNDGVEAEQQRCGNFNIENYR